MFSTFTGNSRRPRNVNLSGQAGNPFANTSWTPSAVSNATKTVSNAQADREKRHIERQRLKAAGKIQRTWRGHRARTKLHESQRLTFDELYTSISTLPYSQRLPQAFKLILSFFTRRRKDDIQRLATYAHDTDSAELSSIAPPHVHHSRIQRLVRLLIEAVDSIVSDKDAAADTQVLLKLIIRIASDSPEAILPSIEKYYNVLARLCEKQDAPAELQNFLLKALATPLNANSQDGLKVYHAFAFSFLTNGPIPLFEEHIQHFSKVVVAPKLAQVIVDELSSTSVNRKPRDSLLWLLAHYIDLGSLSSDAAHRFNYLETLYTQLAILSPEISVRMSIKSSIDSADPESSPDESLLQPMHPYISTRLLSLVETDGISKLLRDFSTNLASSSSQEFYGTSLLAGHILTLLQCFPGSGDDIRMRLFLEEIPVPSGNVPTVKFLWQIMKETAIFNKLRTESERPIEVLRRYLRSGSDSSKNMTEEQEWRVILLFLDLYIFILRLSDDEDFFSGIHPQILQTNPSTSRIRACSLSLADIEILTIFLKNTAFTLHYKSQALFQSPEFLEAASRSRIDTYFGSASTTNQTQSAATSSPTTRLDLVSLRGILTVAMTMLYERDSRKQFLPMNHWLMTDKLDKEDFISAVIAEEQRQNEEDEDNSDEDAESDIEHDLVSNSNFYSTMAGQRLSRHARLERLKAQQLRLQRERRLAELGPKLEILKHMPFVVPFDTRVMIFRQFVELDRARRDGTINMTDPFHHPFARHHARIRRQRLFDDAYANFYEIGDGLKDHIQITFVDQFGAPEAGIDGGGVTKEFLISVASEAFGDESNGLGMFTSNKEGLLYPDPTAVDALREALRAEGVRESDPEWKDHMATLLKRFEFLGRIVGKCMYEGILVDLAFARFFLLKWPSSGANDETSYKGSINDLRDMDEELYKGMLGLKNYSGDISDLGIDFTVTDQISRPGDPVKTVTRKLISNGDQTYVTNDNRLLYISYIARHRLVVQPSLQTTAFLRGLRAIIRPSWLSMFNQSELQRLVGGDSSEIDIEDLRRNTIYSGLYEIGDDGQEHDTIKLFWKVMGGFTDEQRRKVLKYVSSTPRAPLLGFSQLRPKFSIRDGGTDEDRLPSTSTCVNLLKLPRYTTEKTLREKLIYAITSNAGFDLS
ncbi:hypothetical protein BGZ63DRAFT_378362 [Mariannaea sp. PMI_226]|nr:hypothetical protein BGZ63DRAFT_378362 [Mariannaea sp. PMI_226]